MRTEQQDKILDVAERLFLQKGVTLTSINDICAEIGISKGTLYYHYPSKNAIVEELAHRYIDKSETVLDNFFNSAKDKSIETMICECMNTVRLKKTSEKLHYMLMAYGVVAYPKLKTIIADRYALWIEKINSILECYRPNNSGNLVLSQVIMSIFDGFALRNVLDMPSLLDNNDVAQEFIKILKLNYENSGISNRE